MEGASKSRFGLWLGIAVFLLAAAVPPPDGLSAGGWWTVACAMLMAVWWITEAIPIPATALFPLALFPLLGIASIRDTASPYANPVIFLFLGGFLIAAALERCGLHRRIALTILRMVGTTAPALVGGFMTATAFISMWVSNTATVVMMLPTAMSVIAIAEREMNADDGKKFGKALMLALAYSANIGGIATLIGTPPNALLAGFMNETHGISIGFVEWMFFGVPLVVVALPLTWLILVRLLYPLKRAELSRGSEVIDREMKELGAMSRAEWIVGIVTTAVAASWIFRPVLERWVPGLSDAGIAVFGALLLFAVPVSADRRRALTWEDTKSLPWGVLILFGGGLSLASAISTTGVADWIGNSIQRWEALPFFVIFVLVTVIVVFMTELTSNTATAAALLPIVASVSIGFGHDPMALAVPAAVAASCAFMMPVATPPNAIVYGSDRLTIADMAKAGLWVNLLMIVLIDIFAWIWVGR